MLHDSIRDAVDFEIGNIAADDAELWAPGEYDVIFCRNVLMYFTPEAARAAVARITRALAPGGYLFLGYAETLRGLSNDYELCHTHGTFYYQLRGADARAAERIAPAPVLPGTTFAAVVDDAGSWVEAIHRASERIRALSAADASPPAPAVASWDLSSVIELLRRERYAEALAGLDALPSESRHDPDVMLLRAVILIHGGQLPAAEASCKRLLAADAHCAGAHYVLALCREGAGDHQGAVDHDQRAIYVDPSFAMAHLHLGILARRAGDRDQARHELGQAITLLQREDASRLLLFGGGFQREALISLCRAELAAAGGGR